MITRIEFDNFKCLDKKAFDLGCVNLFTGYNGRGKSSVIQSILLLAQSIKNNDTSGFMKLHLNGSLLELGDFDELLTDEQKDSFCFIFSITINGEEHKVRLGYGLGDGSDCKVGKLCTCEIDDKDYFDTIGGNSGDSKLENAKQLNTLPNYLIDLFKEANIHFVAANRLGPTKFVETLEIPEVHKVGADGSMTINTISTYDSIIDPTMNIEKDDQKNYTLAESVSLWINYIMNGGDVSVMGDEQKEKGKSKSSILSLGFDFTQNDKKRNFKSYNVGFGYSYILPIIVTALIAKKGSMVFIENPEAHLHPQAQLRITYLLAKLAARGVQVFIESHSEHVVNGLRLAALKKEFQLTHEDTKIFYFNEKFEMNPLNIEKNGRINNWPAGFFDQYNQELAEILLLGAQTK